MLTFMNRRCDFHFELEISTYMISWEPSAKVIAENLVTAKTKMLGFFYNFNWFYFSSVFYQRLLSGESQHEST